VNNFICNKENQHEIKIYKVKSLGIDFDGGQMKDVEVIKIKRNGITLTFPLREFWQRLERNEAYENRKDT